MLLPLVPTVVITITLPTRSNEIERQREPTAGKLLMHFYFCSMGRYSIFVHPATFVYIATVCGGYDAATGLLTTNDRLAVYDPLGDDGGPAASTENVKNNFA